MTAQAIFFSVGWTAASFWVGVVFAVSTLDLAPYHNRQHYRRTAAFNAGVFGLFSAAIWWLP